MARSPDTVAADREVAAAGPAPARNPTRRWGLLLIIGWLVQAGLRAWFSRAQVVPLATPDESAYLIAARVLAGGLPANFSYSTLYPAGYPLLITPVFWFTSNPATAYHAILMINAAISALVMPLGYLACRRLGLDRPAAYGVATVAALVPAGFFYAEYAITDAIFPVITLAWPLTVHSWLTAGSSRARYAAAAGSALLAGYSYAVHSRGLVIVACYLAVGIFVTIRRLVPRGTAAAAALALGPTLGATRALARTLKAGAEGQIAVEDPGSGGARDELAYWGLAPGAGTSRRARADGGRPGGHRPAGGAAHARSPVPDRGGARPVAAPSAAGLGRRGRCADHRGRLRRGVPLRPGAGARAAGLGSTQRTRPTSCARPPAGSAGSCGPAG